MPMGQIELGPDEEKGACGNACRSTTLGGARAKGKGSPPPGMSSRARNRAYGLGADAWSRRRLRDIQRRLEKTAPRE